MSGERIIKKTENTVWVKDASDFSVFEWGGSCMRIEDIVKPKGGRNPTYCQNPREGGVQITGTLKALAGLPTTSLVMKESVASEMADSLENCLWHLDRRTHCEDLDHWDAWEKIRRMCYAGATDRTDMGSDFDQDETENMTTMPFTGEDVITVYRVAASVQNDPESVGAAWTAVSVCHGERCGSRCNSEKQCVVAAVTEIDGVLYASPHLLINNNGGKPGYWTDYTLTEWSTDDAIDVLCLGNFVLIVSGDTTHVDSQFLRSYDQGVTRQEIVGNADMVANSHEVTCIDALTQAMIVAGGNDGYIYQSKDGGTTWITVDPGVATTQNLNDIKIAHDNQDVIYAIGQSNAIVKSENGGENWFALTGPSPADNLTALYILNEYSILVGNDDGEVWESTDGGETWTQQVINFPVTPAADTTTIAGFAGCGCGVVWMIVRDANVASFSVDTEQYLFRNVDGGASGKWYLPENGTLDVVSGQIPLDVACCGPNRVIVVGGATGTSGMVAVAA